MKQDHRNPWQREFESALLAGREVHLLKPLEFGTRVLKLDMHCNVDNFAEQYYQMKLKPTQKRSRARKSLRINYEGTQSDNTN